MRTRENNPLDSVRRMALLLLTFTLTLGLTASTRPPEGGLFIRAGVVDGELVLATFGGKVWKAPLFEGCDIVAYAMVNPNAMPKIDVKATEGGLRSDEECRGLYRPPERAPGVSGP